MLRTSTYNYFLSNIISSRIYLRKKIAPILNLYYHAFTLRQAKILFEQYRLDMRKKKRDAEEALERERKLRTDTDKVEEKKEAPILGRCYERKTRFRKPIVPPKLTRLGDKYTYNVYDKLECSPLLVCHYRYIVFIFMLLFAIQLCTIGLPPE